MMIFLDITLFFVFIILPINGQCPINYCLNGGTCLVCNPATNNCPANYTFYCICQSDYCDDNCAVRRQAVALITLKSNNTYTTEYANPASASYNIFSNTIILILQRSYQYIYSTRGVNDLAVSVQVLNLSSGSILATAALSLGMKTGFTSSASFQLPTTSEMSSALTNVCTGTLCSSIALDQTYSFGEANPNLCNTNKMNSCSLYAICTFLGGVNYTCACRPSYRDDSNSTGRICTPIPCSSGTALDITFILDASGSIGIDPFQTGLKPAVKGIIDRLNPTSNVSLGSNRFACVVFANTSRIEWSFDTYTNKTQLYKQVDLITYDASYTATGDALYLAYTALHPLVRPGASHILIIITDGEANAGTYDWFNVADAMKKDGIFVFVVGVGSINYDAINKVSSGPEFRADVNNYQALVQQTEKIANLTCKNFTSLAPPSCPEQYCYNDGTCRDGNCPGTATYCCICPADFIGDRCEEKRGNSALIEFRSDQPYSNDLRNTASIAFTFLAKLFIDVCQKSMSIFYNTKGIANCLVKCKVLNFVNGSVYANMSVDAGVPAASSNNISVLPSPTKSDISNSLASACNGTLCSSFRLNQSYVNVIANPNLCLSNSTNTCSEYANCTFYSGVNYTCTCNSGYQDIGSSSQPGRICLEIGRCTNSSCLNGGTCVTDICSNNSSSCCKCLSDYVGDKCAVKSQVAMIQTYKCGQNFSSNLLNSTSTEFIVLAKTFVTICQRAMEFFYNSKNVSDAVVSCRVINFAQGSTLANMSVNVARTSGDVSIPIPNSADLTVALSGSCSNTTCDSISLDSSYVTIIVLTTAPVPTQCTNSSCLNGGTCVTENCPNNSPSCCKCSTDYVGDQCTIKRQVTMIQTFKCEQTFTTALLNSTSTEFINLAKIFITICQKAMEFFYNSKNVMDASVTCRMMNFAQGSILANMSVDAGRSTSATSLPIPNAADMTAALSGSCSNTTCDKIGLDKNSVAVTVNPNMCLTGVCSQFATCTFYGGVNFTCSCNAGFEDESSGLPSGRICTQTCRNHICFRTTCEQRKGKEYLCICPEGFSGRYCQNGSQRAGIPHLITFMCCLFYLLVSFQMKV